MTDHPFVPGARVAISHRHNDDVAEGFVDKVYKTGRFTLRGSSQQWKAWQNSYGDRSWSASETGDGYYRRRLEIWDADTDKAIAARIEATRARNRWRDLRSKVDRVRQPTSVLCDAVEAALTTFEKTSEEQ